MKNLAEDKTAFEHAWKKTFEDVEMSPSESLWVNIDAQLANTESVKLKKRIVWYRAIAVASFAAVLFSLGYIYINNNNDLAESQSIVLNEKVSSEQLQINVSEAEKVDLELASSNKVQNLQETINTTSNDYDSRGNKSMSPTKNALIAIADSDEISVKIKKNLVPKSDSFSKSHENSEVKSNDLLQVVNKNNPALGDDKVLYKTHTRSSEFSNQDGQAIVVTAKNEEDLIESYQAQLGTSSESRDTNKKYQFLAKMHPRSFDLVFVELNQKNLEMNKILVLDELEMFKKFNLNSTWAALSVAPSAFDPNFSAGGSSSNADLSFSAVQGSNLDGDLFITNRSNESQVLDQVANSYEASAEISYQYGIQAAFPLSQHWFVQSGLNYSINKTAVSTGLSVQDQNTAVRQPVYVTTIAKQEHILSVPMLDVASSPIPLSSSYEIIRVPLKAGYLLPVGNKLGMMISAGISADLFLKNEVASDAPGFETVTVRSDIDSPFRSMYFNGISSIAVFYQLTDRYLISLEPSYSQAFTNFSKEDSDFTSHPKSYGLGVALTYKFDR